MAWTKRDEESILGKNWRRNSPQEQFRCSGCFREFWRDTRETWKVHCDNCWPHSPQAKRDHRDKMTALIAEREQVLQDKKIIEQEREAMQMEKANTQKEIDVLNDIVNSFIDGKFSIPSEMLSRLVRLCHPDKHGNSPASNEVTSWLLAQRQK